MSPILLFVPALLMLSAIVGIPQDWPTFLTRPRWRWLALFALLAIGIWLSIIPGYQREEVGLGFALFVLPHLFTCIAAFLIQAGLRSSSLSWSFLAGGSTLLLLVCLSSAYVARLGYLFPFFAFLTAIAVCGVAVVSAVWIAWTLYGRRKLIALCMGLIFPLALFGSVQWGNFYSPVPTIERNGEVVVQALNQYRANSGVYPQSLAVLVPEYVTELREPGTIWGWLYTSDGDDFTLGYVRDVDKMGYGICKYSAKVPTWDCPLDYSTAPFTLAPTPAP